VAIPPEFSTFTRILRSCKAEVQVCGKERRAALLPAYRSKLSTCNVRPRSLHHKTSVVTGCGRICLGKKRINFSTVFAGQAVGIEEVHDHLAGQLYEL